ncbi:hypothetical protein KM043_018858, partial [Ampulex compressa]
MAEGTRSKAHTDSEAQRLDERVETRQRELEKQMRTTEGNQQKLDLVIQALDKLKPGIDKVERMAKRLDFLEQQIQTPR